MTYNPEKQFDSIVKEFEGPGRTLLEAIRHGQESYDEWQSFRDNRTDADIATALTATSGRTVTAAEVADVDAAYSAFDSISRYLNNDTPPTAIDHGFAMRVLT